MPAVSTGSATCTSQRQGPFSRRLLWGGFELKKLLRMKLVLSSGVFNPVSGASGHSCKAFLLVAQANRLEAHVWLAGQRGRLPKGTLSK